MASFTPPTVGQLNTNEDPKTATALTVLDNLLDSGDQVPTAGIADSAVTSIKIANGTVADGDLASPNNSVFKLLLQEVCGSTNATGTYHFTQGSTLSTGASTGAAGTGSPRLFDYASGDYAVAGLTTRFRVKLEIHVGATSPSTVTFTAGLYPVTIVAGVWTLGTVVAGSTALSSGLATNTISRFNSGDFAASALLSDPGTYVLGVVVGSITVPAGITIAAQLQTRNT